MGSLPLRQSKFANASMNQLMRAPATCTRCSITQWTKIYCEVAVKQWFCDVAVDLARKRAQTDAFTDAY